MRLTQSSGMRPMPCLSRELGAEVWVKSEAHCGALYGGNKVRKLEFLLADALDRGCRSIVAVGGCGSNYVVATAIYARQKGLDTHAVLFPQPVTEEVRSNVRLALTLGVDPIPAANRLLLPLAVARARRRAPRPCVTPPGGSSPLGTLGWVAAGLELGQQIASRELPEPDEVFLPLGSAGSMAGLVLACRLLGLRLKVVGVRVVDRVLVNATIVRLLVLRTASLLRRRFGGLFSLERENMVVLHRHFGGRYGRPTPEARQAVQQARQHEGLVLETTYSAKAMAALVDRCRGPNRPRRLLFWNTYNAQDTTRLLAGAPEPEPPGWLARWLQSGPT